jgi:PAS domain-containing protein
VFDRDLRFVALNDALAAVNGLPRDAHVGRYGPELLPHLDEEAWSVVRAVIASGRPVSHLVHGRTPATADEHVWEEEVHPWLDAATGEVLGAFVTAVVPRTRPNARTRG